MTANNSKNNNITFPVITNFNALDVEQKLSDPFESPIIEGFGDYQKKEKGVFYEGKCYLKTKTDHFKSHWAVLDGNEILFYRKQGEEESRVMHILACTFV